MKTCLGCSQSLPLEAFARRTRSKDGRQAYCRRCTAIWAREHRPRKLAQKPQVAAGQKWCRRCEQVKILDDFPLHRKMPDGRQTYCKACFADIYRQKREDAGFTARPADIPEGFKFCRGCSEVLPLSEWPIRSTSRDGVAGRCTKCFKARDRERNLVKKYGLSAAEVDALLADQRGLCAICGVAPAVHVDHDHQSGAIRGMCCFSCNAALGQFGDDPCVIEDAAAYLRGPLIGFQRDAFGVVSVVRLPRPSPELTERERSRLGSPPNVAFLREIVRRNAASHSRQRGRAVGS